MKMKINKQVQEALETNKPVVALESTIISHGLPYPRSIAAAKEFEQQLIDAGVVPATIGIINGVPTIGLDQNELQQIAAEGTAKSSVRDLPIIAAKGINGATTVAATAFLAARAGIRVFATGGLGGVHRGASETFDESADLTTLSNSPVVVVSAGVKSVLDISATLERLETLSIPVVGYKTTNFPSFWLPTSDYTLDWSVESAAEVAAIVFEQRKLGVQAALLIANPVPEDQAWNKADHDMVLEKAFAAAKKAGVRGKQVTPFLLDFIVGASNQASLEVNLSLVRNNIFVAGEISKAIAQGGAH
jgi:pseudouridine-5'-phosphate glycosidase